MKEIKKIKKISAANLLAFVYASVGFLFGVGFYLFFMISAIYHDHVVGSLTEFIFVNLIFTLILGLVVAIVVGAVGWILGFLFSLLYNFYAQKVGGAKIETHHKH